MQYMHCISHTPHTAHCKLPVYAEAHLQLDVDGMGGWVSWPALRVCVGACVWVGVCGCGCGCKHVCGRECRHAEKHHLCLFEKVFRGSRLIYRSRERIFVPTTRQHATAARLSEVLFEVPVYTLVCTHVCTHIHTLFRTHTYAHARIHACAHVCTHGSAHVCARVCAHVGAHTIVHTLAHIQVLGRAFPT